MLCENINYHVTTIFMERFSYNSAGINPAVIDNSLFDAISCSGGKLGTGGIKTYSGQIVKFRNKNLAIQK